MKSQGRDDFKVHWTPVFALGKVYIYVCDGGAAARDATLPARLNEGQELAKFVKNGLPGILQEMKDEHGWNRAPRTIVHDKRFCRCAGLLRQAVLLVCKPVPTSSFARMHARSDKRCC